jgi:hypothetical protein
MINRFLYLVYVAALGFIIIMSVTFIIIGLLTGEILHV